jgi:hypothetical protein
MDYADGKINLLWYLMILLSYLGGDLSKTIKL